MLFVQCSYRNFENRFLFKFTGKEEEINLLGDGSETPEFKDWAWLLPERVLELVSNTLLVTFNRKSMFRCLILLCSLSRLLVPRSQSMNKLWRYLVHIFRQMQMRVIVLDKTKPRPGCTWSQLLCKAWIAEIFVSKSHDITNYGTLPIFISI